MPCETPTELAMPLDGRRILLADDIRTMRHIYSSALTRAGAAVTTVEDGAAAVAVCDEAEAERPFDAVVLDYAMPRLDGGRAAAALRGRGYAGAIVGISAEVRDHEVGPWMAAGCDAVLRKGVALGEFVACVGEACRRRYDER